MIYYFSGLCPGLRTSINRTQRIHHTKAQHSPLDRFQIKKQPRTYLYLYGTVLYLPSRQLTRRVLYAGAARRSYNPVPRARNGNQGPSQLSPRHRRAPAGEATKRRGSGEAAKQVVVGWS